MHSRIVVAVATILTASLAYSHAGTSRIGTTSSSQLRSYTKALTAKTRIKTSVEEFVFWMDEAKWKQEKSDNPHLLKFSYVNSDIGAVIISGRIGIPTTVLRDKVLKSGQETDPSAQITFEEKRIVNGQQVLVIEISTTMEGELYKFLGYFHGGASGSIAVIGIVPETLFTKNKGDLTEFLNGLEIAEQELRTSASREVISNKENLSVNPKVRIEYDPQKWKQAKSTEVATFLFTHSSGDGYVKIICELPMGVRKSETVAPVHPVMPVGDGFGGRDIGINSHQL
jgi:hypothetical protein